MLETFLIHMGCIGQDPDIGRKLMKSTHLGFKALTSRWMCLLATWESVLPRKKALCRAAESIAGTTTSGRTVAGSE